MSSPEIKLSDTLKSLSNDLIVDSHQVESAFHLFIQLRTQQERPEYAIITAFVFDAEYDESTDGEENLEILELNLSIVAEHSGEKEDNEMEGYIHKLIDHINLAKQQKAYMDSTVEVTEERLKVIDKKTEEINNMASDSYEQLERIQNLKARIYAEFVTILGIFATIIFAAFGGLEMLNNVLGNINTVRTAKLMIFSSLTIAAIILLLFILLNGIARLTGLNLRSCGCLYEEECRHNLVQKHPTIAVAYLVLTYLFIMGLLAYAFDFYVVQSVISPLNSVVQSIIILLLLFGIAIGLVLYFRNRLKNATGSKEG